jgi:hypothetical protein
MTITSGFTINDAFTETCYYYVDHLPEWTSYTNNVVDRATNEW